MKISSYESMLIHQILHDLYEYPERWRGVGFGFASEDHKALKDLMTRLEEYFDDDSYADYLDGDW